MVKLILKDASVSHTDAITTRLDKQLISKVQKYCSYYLLVVLLRELNSAQYLKIKNLVR